MYRHNSLILAGIMLTTSLFAQPGESQYPKNIVLVIADGLGLAHIGILSHLEKEPIVLEKFPVIGLQKTHSASSLVTDSGAAATAMSCGTKTYNSAIGVNADTIPCTNLFSLAGQAGLKTGLVVTSSLVHATPGAFVAHQPFRGFREAIAADFVNTRMNYVVGGGLMYFAGRFTDDRNIRYELEDSGYAVYDYNQVSMRGFSKKTYESGIYFTAHSEPDTRNQGRTYFADAVGLGMERLDNESGYVMVVEASQIDFAGHDNDKNYLIAELRDFHEMLETVFEVAKRDGETLVIVTSDHSTAGVAVLSGKPSPGKVKFSFETTRHTADMVPVFAYGPGAEIFGGVYENTEIFYKIRELGGF